MVKNQPEQTIKPSARVVFIAHLDLIKGELEEGYSARAIYRRYPTKIGAAISYPQFVRYVRELREGGITPPVGGSGLGIANLLAQG